MKLIEYFTLYELNLKRKNLSNFADLSLKDIVSSLNLPNNRVIISFLFVWKHIDYIEIFYLDEKDESIWVDYSLSELIKLAKLQRLINIIPFENLNAMLVYTDSG